MFCTFACFACLCLFSFCDSCLSLSCFCSLLLTFKPVFLNHMESVIGVLKCQQDLWLPLLVTSSLKALSSIIFLFYWIGLLGLHPVHTVFHAFSGIVCGQHSAVNHLTDWVIYSNSIASFICYRFVPLCQGPDWLDAVWYVWYSVVLVLCPVN